MVIWTALAAVILALLPSPAASQDRPADADRVVLFGVPGLRWSAVSAAETPAIWRLFGEGSAAAMSVRTVRPSGCPIDDWLTLGAGVRATAPRDGGDCIAPAQPEAEFAAIVEENEDYSYDPEFGLLATTVERSGGCVTAVGPGAANAVATGSGEVDPHIGADCAVTLVDLGGMSLREADAQIAMITSGVPAETTVIVAGLSDEDGSRPHLTTLVVSGPGFDEGWLTASSTRQDGLVQLTDLAPTILDVAGLAAPASMVGAVVKPVGGRPADIDTAWQRLAQQDVAAQTIRDYAGVFFLALELGQILLYLLVAYALRRRRSTVLYVGALFIASAPAASFLANLVPWWRAERPAPVLGGLVLGWTVALTVAALAGPWRRWHLLGPAGFIALVTVAVLALNVSLGGSYLQLSSLYGLSPLIAGRFYGFGNVAFAVFAMASLFAALAAAAYWLARGNRRAAVVSVAVIGLVAIVVDGWPTWGADFGGVVAMVPGFGLLALAAAGVRPSLRTAVAAGLAALVAVSALALVDWLRPADERSHLGRFVEDVVSGGAGDILQRKFDANIATFTRGPEGVAIPLILIAIGYVLARPERIRTLKGAIDRVPILRPGLVAMLVTAILGFAVNDSGIQVAAVCLVVAMPLVVASCARQLHGPREQHDPGDRRERSANVASDPI